MNSKIKLPEEVNADTFILQFNDYFSNNLSKDMCALLSGLLAIDYATRLKSEPDLNDYITLCIKRLRAYLGYKVITDEGFSAAMMLFTIAITPEEKFDNEKSFLNQEKSQDIMIDAMINSHFSELSASNRNRMRLLLKELLTGKDGHDLINLIDSNPDLFSSISLNAFKKKKQQQEITKFVRTNISKALVKSKNINSRINKIKDISGQLVLAGSVLLATSISLAIGGLALPAIAIPATAAAIKYAPEIGEKLGNVIIKTDADINRKRADLKKVATKNLAIITKAKSQKSYVDEKKVKTKKITSSLEISHALDTTRTKSQKTSKIRNI